VAVLVREKAKEQVNEYVVAPARPRKRSAPLSSRASQQVAALVDQSKEQVNEHAGRARQAAEEVSAVSSRASRQVNEVRGSHPPGGGRGQRPRRQEQAAFERVRWIATRQAAEEVSAMVDQSKQAGNGHVDRTRQAAEEVGAMVDPSQQQGKRRMDRKAR